jgi:hypothetical protein
MAPLDGKWFSGIDELPESIAENLGVNSLGHPVNAVLGRNGWDGKTVAGIGLELSNDNRSIRSGQFYVRGPLSVDDGSYQASKLWETAPKDISITVQFPHGGEFNFSEGSLASDYLEGDAVKMSAERNGQVIPAAEWARLGMKPFSLRLIAYLDKTSNKSEPKIKFTLLFFPATKGEMEELSDAVRGPAWPGIKILEGNAELFPRAPMGGWGCPIYPVLCTGAKFRQVPNLPPGEEIRYAISKIFSTARLPVPCANYGTMMRKWLKIQQDPDSYEERMPTVTWPQTAEPANRTG